MVREAETLEHEEATEEPEELKLEQKEYEFDIY